MSGRAVDVVAFDVNETLFSLDRLGPAFAEAGLDPAAVPLWFARLLRDGFALTAIGQYRPFADLAADALRGLTPDLPEETVGQVLAAFRNLDAHPDVEPALRKLDEAGVPVVTLTNGSAALVQGLLSRAGLSGYVRQCLSVDEVRVWKPAPEPYQYAARVMGVDPARLGLVAAHPWDCAGAQAAGLRCGWVSRTPAAWPSSFAPPDAAGADLSQVVASLLTAS